MNERKKLTKTIVIRITEDQCRKLIETIKSNRSHCDKVINNKSQVIREMMDRYLVPKIS